MHGVMWVCLQPFVEEENILSRVFPEKRYAFLVPVFVGIALFCVTVGNLGYVLLATGLRQSIASTNSVK